MSAMTSSDRRWWALAVLSITQLMVALDATVINIALPHAQHDLHFSLANRQWLITAYALAFGSLLLVGGRLSDLWGRRTSLYVGLTGFALASALGGSAHSFTTLVTARAVQGVFGAVLAPAALATLSSMFNVPKERAKAFSIYGAIGASGAAIGLLLGGALTQWATWRWCLFINLVFAAIALVGVAFFITGDKRAHDTNLDVVGTLLGSAGLFFVVYGFAHAVNTGWANYITWGSLVIGGVLLVAFVRWQQRSKNPLLPLRLLINRVRGGSLVALFLTSSGIFGISLFLAYYLQGTLGYSPLRTGVAFLPLVAAIALSAFIASARLLAVSGPRPLVPTGMLLSGMGMVLFTKLTPNADYVSNVLPGLVVTGLGLGLIFAPAIASATAGVRLSDVGAASALVNTTQQIGGSMGVALLNTIAVSVTARSNRVPVPMTAQLSRKAAQHHAAVLATLHGYAVAFWWAAAFFGVGAILTFGLLESGVPDHDDSVAATT
ncbi:MAG TPA: MFS transporter [Acidimicrobiales bacterium]|nr:MFS transporter [Acidimicrobiales bacterium]